MTVNYKIKKGMKNNIRKIIRYNKLAEKVGVNSCYLSEIMNGRTTSKKSLVYCIAKAVSPELEITDLFDIV